MLACSKLLIAKGGESLRGYSAEIVARTLKKMFNVAVTDPGVYVAYRKSHKSTDILEMIPSD